MNPREKVCKLNGLLTPEDQMSIKVDYSEPVEALYTKVAILILKRETSLGIISSVRCNDKKHDSSLPFPLWVPNWSQDPVLLPEDYPTSL